MVKSETKPSTPPEELLDEEVFMGLCNYDQSKPGELEEEVAKYHKEAFSPPSLLTRDAERQKPGGEIQLELKGLRDVIVPLSQKLETLQVSSSYHSGWFRSTLVQRPPRAQHSVLGMHLLYKLVLERLLTAGRMAKGFRSFQ